ncbi:hypothetical protein [Bradyrhizobium sp. SYSU BS000235]|uniref:hypothetical protein n=1 Tax=Bradyrhizobium sp. SYSU BS000235 TaxID=3411332 RepID=UPI003C76D475
MPWDTQFDAVVELPNGHPLFTLADARTYILKLSAEVRDSQSARTAADALIAAASGVGAISAAHAAMVLLVQEQWEPTESGGEDL